MKNKPFLKEILLFLCFSYFFMKLAGCCTEGARRHRCSCRRRECVGASGRAQAPVGAAARSCFTAPEHLYLLRPTAAPCLNFPPTATNKQHPSRAEHCGNTVQTRCSDTEQHSCSSEQNISMSGYFGKCRLMQSGCRPKC